MPDITIKTPDGQSFTAYVAMPKRAGPVVVMIQEIFGVNQEMRDKCDAMAKLGYVAVCPDLFWRIEPGLQLVDSDEAQLARAFELFGQFDIDTGLEDLKTTVTAMKNLDACVGKVATVGYCLGGKLAYMLACDGAVDAAVAYYGVGIDGMLDKAQGSKTHVLMHVAEEDEFVPKDAQEKIKLALMPNKRFEIHMYPHCQHAFARTKGMYYDPIAAREALMRTEDFLERHLTPHLREQAAQQ